MIRYVLITLFLVFSLGLQAQRFPQDYWHKGRVLLDTNDTIPGLIKYDLVNNAVQLKVSENEVLAFSSQNLLYFDFTGNKSDRYRQFVSLPYDIRNNNYEIPVFFEIIREGLPMSLLTRERIEEYNEPPSPYMRTPSPNFTYQRIVYDYYFLDEKGKIMPFDGKKRSLDIIFGRDSGMVKKFVKKERLKLDRMTDLARIVSYYNQLKNQ